MHFEMLATKFVASLFLVIIGCQYAQFKQLSTEVKTFNGFFDNTLESRALAITNNKRNIKDVWNNIKNSITNAWNALKVFAKTSKQKMKNMTQKMQARAEEVIKSFENHMNILKEKLNKVIKKVFDETEVVKKCLIEERKAIENVIKEIIQHLTTCIAGSMKNLSLLNVDATKTMNDTNFFKDLENKFKMCEQDLDNAEECLNKVRKDSFDDIERKEIDILKAKMKSRNLADDLLETLIVCSIDAVIEASGSITVEVVHVTKCIIKG